MQTKIICPKCRLDIPLDDVNVSTDIALCRHCGQTWSYEDLLQDNTNDMDLMTPPKGAWFREISPRGFEVGASTRHPIAFFLVPFMCVWSGLSLGGIYGTQFAKGHFDLFVSLIGIPFILGTLVFGSAAAMSACGKVTVTVDGDDGVIFTGVRSIGWRRRFSWRNVTNIRITKTHGQRGTYKQITLDGHKRYHLAANLKDKRMNFMLTALRRKWSETSHSPA